MFTYDLYYPYYKLRDYERDLALLEVQSLFPEIASKKIFKDKIQISLNKKIESDKLNRLTFFAEYKINDVTLAKNNYTDQTIIEHLSRVSDEKISTLNDNTFKRNGSREIRYLTHSFHEYKGRFYPQLAKSLLNQSNIDSSSIVLDPFCGSGTTLLESHLLGYNAVGIDLNPLAVLQSKAKIRSLYISDKELENLLNHFTLSDEIDVNKYRIDLDKFKLLDLDYIKNWFPESTITKILFLLSNINEFSNEDSRLFLSTILSNMLREYSFQDPTQLRIRRRKNDPPLNLFESFSSKLKFHIAILQRFKKLERFNTGSEITFHLGDIRSMTKELNFNQNSVDVIITSPPYATALPYIDTDRLSLFVFGYTTKNSFRQLEKTMIGNREISNKERELLEEHLRNNFNSSILPMEIINLIKEIYILNRDSAVGFRRKNMAALLFKYFQDMYMALLQMYEVLKPDRYCFMVVGNNRTTAGSKSIFIPTIRFISLIAEKIGFTFLKELPLTVQKSYMIHSKNSINTESILYLKK